MNVAVHGKGSLNRPKPAKSWGADEDMADVISFNLIFLDTL
jgi:hypothetical protein